MIKIVKVIYNRKQEKIFFNKYKLNLDSTCAVFMENEFVIDKYPYILWKPQESRDIYKISKKDIELYNIKSFYNIFKFNNKDLKISDIKYLYSFFRKILKKKNNKTKYHIINCNIIKIDNTSNNQTSYIKLAIDNKTAYKMLNGHIKNVKLLIKE